MLFVFVYKSLPRFFFSIFNHRKKKIQSKNIGKCFHSLIWSNFNINRIIKILSKQPNKLLEYKNTPRALTNFCMFIYPILKEKKLLMRKKDLNSKFIMFKLRYCNKDKPNPTLDYILNNNKFHSSSVIEASINCLHYRSNQLNLRPIRFSETA